ncbi:MAG: IPT/TIG domain-containing protein [Acidimicrobiales bacterium]
MFPGANGQFNLYQDAGTGNGYLHGQYSLTPITTSEGLEVPGVGARCPTGGQATDGFGDAGAGGNTPGASTLGDGYAHDAGMTTVVIGAVCGTYPGQASAQSYQVELQSLSQPRLVLVNGRPVAQAQSTGSPGWAYDPAAHTLTVAVDNLSVHDRATIAVVGGHLVTQSEPAAVDLSVNPSTPLSAAAGTSTTVTTTETNDGPGTAAGASVTLSAPAGWAVSPSGAVAVGTLAQGASATQTWDVTAPTGSSPQTASLPAQLTYTSAGQPETVTASEQPVPAAAPLPPPVIRSVNPSTTAAGTAVTLTGDNFGATQGSSYLTLAEPGISWGAPYDGAKLTITNWSNTSISFDLPAGSGVPYPIAPGTATVTVTVDGQTSPAQNITVQGTVVPTPAITSVDPSTTAAGTAVTLTGTNFGSSQGSSYLLLVQGGTSWGAPYDGAKVTITNWSNTSITFDLPAASGVAYPISTGTATIQVNVGGQASNTESITITS